MRKILNLLFFIAILGALYQFRAPIGEKLQPAFENVMARIFMTEPCEEPIPYAIGNFDAKFGISEKYFLAALSDAEKIWEEPFSRELFVHDDSAKNPLDINLIYDYRQEATKKLASIGIVVENNRASYDMLRAKFTALKAEFAKARDAYEASVKSYNIRLAAYEKEVDYWNSRGGAPKKEYDQLEAEKSELNAIASPLSKEESRINEMVTEINSMVVVLNRLATALNLSVERYNTIGSSRGESFEEGVYSSDGFKSEIDIYEFSSREKLVRVLAHELGHALGLDHVKDEEAIMYEYNQGDTEKLTETDLLALRQKCRYEDGVQ